MARFDNKVVLVSGGARGQGAAEARLLVAQGAKVVIGDVLDNQGQALAVELGPAASFVRHDVTSEADWARAVEAALKLGGLHGLVNNAGIYQPAALMETDDALWQRHIQINQYGCFLDMKAVVRAMERSGGGSIVNISSVAGLKGSPGSFAYAAIKWALRGMTKSAAIDLDGRRIRVNSVHPGPIVPMHRYGTPEEVAQLGAFLLSDESSYITGAEIAIDGASSAEPRVLGCHGKFRGLRAYRIEGKRPAGWCPFGPLAHRLWSLAWSTARAAPAIRNPNRRRSSAAPSWGCYAPSQNRHHPLSANPDT